MIPYEGDHTVTSYHPAGQSVTVSRGPTLTYTEFDGFGRVTFSGNAVDVKTRTEYDSDGRKTYQSYPYSGSADVGDHFEYDAVNRVTRIVKPGNAQVTYAYQGTDVLITDENDHTTRQRWQAFGDPSDARLVGIVDAKGAEWLYEYNSVGSLTHVASPMNVHRTWAYDGTTNRLMSETQPESGTTTYGYDAVGNMTAKATPEHTYEYGYDHNNRLRYIKVDGSTQLDMVLDASDNRTWVQTPHVTTTFEYDTINRLRVRTDEIRNGGPTYVTRFDFDPRDNLEKITYPSNRTVCNSYDAGNRITQVNDCHGTPWASSISYHPSGAVTGYVARNGTSETIGFDARSRPTLIRSQRSSALVQELTYGYDNVGNVLAQTNHVDGSRSMTFGYDELDRLTGVGGFGATTYEYDPLGNRTRHGPTTFSYHGSSQHLESMTGGATTFAYEGTGNMVRDADGSTYAYDGFNQMTSASIQGGLATAYGYDGDNQRIVKSNSNGTHYYVHGPGGMLLADYLKTTNNPELDREYVYLGTRLLASVGRVVPATAAALSATLTSPSGGFTEVIGGIISLAASVSVPSGSAVDRVEFWRAGTRIGSDSQAPYELTWDTTGSPAGSQELRARVVTTTGLSSTSAPVSVSLLAPLFPVTLTAPRQGQTFAHKVVSLTAAVTPPPGTSIDAVEYYAGDERIADLNPSLVGPPYIFIWTNAQIGSIRLRVRAHATNGTWAWSPSVTVTVSNQPMPVVGDFDGDGQTDLVVFRPSTARWIIRFSGSQYDYPGWVDPEWGVSGDVPLNGDFDGDRKMDLVVFRPSEGKWFIRYAKDSFSYTGWWSFAFGSSGDVPVPADYDGDGKADLAFFRPSDATWHLRLSWENFSQEYSYQWGLPGDIPQTGDFDGDRRSDLVVYRPTEGNWYIRVSSGNFTYANWTSYQWGLPGDLPMAADADGDLKADLRVYRPSTGEWINRYSGQNYEYTGWTIHQWGLTGDIPLIGYFPLKGNVASDRRADFAVYRPGDGTWHIRFVNESFPYEDWRTYQWGLPGDIVPFAWRQQ